jgi:hypothetical protein
MRNSFTFQSLINSNDESGQFEIDAEIEELLISMDIEEFAPASHSVQFVMDFARSFEVMPSESAGMIEMNLN